MAILLEIYRFHKTKLKMWRIILIDIPDQILTPFFVTFLPNYAKLLGSYYKACLKWDSVRVFPIKKNRHSLKRRHCN